MKVVLSVIAGGWSFRDVDHTKVPGLVIGVNDALLYFNAPLYRVVSMDRLWTEHRWGHLVAHQVGAFIRKSALRRVPWEQDWPWLHPFDNVNDGSPFTESELHLNGASSGACALNLSYVIKPAEVYMFGFDMNLSPDGKSHWHPLYPWVNGKEGKGAYVAWATHFRTYAEQFKAAGIKVRNVSPTSAIESFEKISAQELGVAS